MSLEYPCVYYKPGGLCEKYSTDGITSYCVQGPCPDQSLLEAWKGFRMRREWLTDDFCRPVYELWLTEAVARGRISAPGFLTDPIIRQAYLASEWIGPSQGQLDPTKEVAAAVTAIENGLSTREAESIRLNGSEYAANADKLAVENELLRRANGAGHAPQAAEDPPVDTGEEEE